VPVPRISGIIAEALDEPARAERDRIEGALDATDGHRERAAAILGMSRTTLWTRMRMLGIECDRFHTPKAKAQ
jgi:transcriptional regulator of acetoin/glycerol metabolism